MNQKNTAWLSHLSEFECQRCLKCCTNPGYIYVLEEEVQPISNYLGLSGFKFVNQYCDLIEKPRLTLKTHPDGTCVMLKGNTCQIHPVKPKQCRDFPVRWRTKDAREYCEGLKLLTQHYPA
ncbi:MAG: YkgJ family cysteine cluster protein [Candidatus Omnitrophica bacterium]|nr:YkgJ family cysteine cluster protein [Candidatus Omnitrophota bacterium]